MSVVPVRLHLVLRLICSLFLISSGAVLAADDRFTEREAMVDNQIVARGIRDPATLRAMRTVPRHAFVPAAQSRFAYSDRPLPIGHGQTISQPYIVAYMTEIVAPGPGRKILEIGTGSGYQAAVLAAAGADVYSIEIIPQLSRTATERLGKAGFGQVQSKTADGYFGWPEQAPFDAIIVTAAAAFVPPPLIEQLASGGVMVIPVGSPFFVQTLMLVEKMNDGSIRSANLMPVSFVPFRRAQ